MGRAGGYVTGTQPPTVRDDRSQDRFVFEKDGAVAELVYEVDPSRLFLIHTEVPEALRGQGVGGQLVTAAVGRALDDGLTVVPWCPYARRWLDRHPDVADSVVVDWTTVPPSHP
jgi:uncharacterized protein